MNDCIPEGNPLAEVLIFELNGQRYGVPLANVEEVVRALTPTQLPDAPSILEGIFNRRGELVPILDIRARFQLSAKPLDATDHLVVARVPDRTVAIRVDRALDIRRLAPNDIEDARQLKPTSEWIAGVAKLSDGLLLIHDLNTFLTEAEAAAIAKVADEADRE